MKPAAGTKTKPMQEIFQQLGELVLGSVPTIFFFLFLLGAYSILVRRPLAKTLAERHARTGGAMEEARNAIASAEQKTSEYEVKLRHARAQIFEARQARLKATSGARDHALAEAREHAGKQIAAARGSVERSGVDAKAQIELAVAGLSQQILAAILPGRGTQAGAAQ